MLPFSGKVAIGEMVAVKALMSSAVEAIELGDGGVAVSVRCVFHWERGLCGVIVGVVDVGRVCIRVILVFVASHG